MYNILTIGGASVFVMFYFSHFHFTEKILIYDLTYDFKEELQSDYINSPLSPHSFLFHFSRSLNPISNIEKYLWAKQSCLLGYLPKNSFHFWNFFDTCCHFFHFLKEKRSLLFFCCYTIGNHLNGFLFFFLILKMTLPVQLLENTSSIPKRKWRRYNAQSWMMIL